jgi:hypothetical protein
VQAANQRDELREGGVTVTRMAGAAIINLPLSFQHCTCFSAQPVPTKCVSDSQLRTRRTSPWAAFSMRAASHVGER